MPQDITSWANRCRSLHVISRPCSGCVHGCLYAICQQEHSCMLSPPPGYTATPLRVHRWWSSISYRTISVITDNMFVGVVRLSSTAARFCAGSPFPPESGEACHECWLVAGVGHGPVTRLCWLWLLCCEVECTVCPGMKRGLCI